MPPYLEQIIDPVTYHLLIAAFLGACIGFERELARKDPSLRTFMLISLGSCVFALISISATEGIFHGDPGRIAAQIVSGVGFLCAGSIFRSRDKVVGLTTAALIWVTASVGMAVGFGRIDIGFKAALVALSFMFLLSLVHQLFRWLSGER